MTTLRSISLHFVDLLVWCSLGPVVVPVFLFFWIFKCFVGLLLHLKQPDLAFVTDVDSIIAREVVKPETICDDGTILKLDSTLSIEQLRERFLETVKPNQNVCKSNPVYRLHCRFTTFWGYLCHQAVAIDVDRQIYEEKNAEGQSAEDFFSIWFSRPYRNNNLPRWEMVLFQDPDCQCSYVGFRVHHGIMDGSGLIILLDLLCGSNTPLPGTLPIGIRSTFLGRLKLWFILPREVLTFFLTTDPVEYATKDELQKQFYFLSLTSMDLRRLLMIRRKLGIGFNPLMYSIQSEALLIFMKERRKGVKLSSSFPVIHTIASDNPHPGGMRNHYGIVRLDLPFEEERMTSVERSFRVDSIYKDFLEREGHTLGLYYVTFLANLLPMVLHPFNFNSRMTFCKAHLANMKISSEPYYILGKKLTNIYCLTPPSPTIDPNIVVLTDLWSRGDTVDIAHFGTNRVFRTKEDLDFYATVCVPKVIAALERDINKS